MLWGLCINTTWDEYCVKLKKSYPLKSGSNAIVYTENKGCLIINS